MSKRPSSPTKEGPLPAKLQDDFLLYFNNFIEIRNENYICHLCKVIMPSLFTVMSHINSSEHENSIINRRLSHTINRERPPKLNICELFVKNGIFRFYPRVLKCHTCDCLLISFKFAKKHSRDPDHESKQKLTFEFKEPAEQENENKTKADQKYPDFIRYGYKDDDHKILTCYICSITELWKTHKEDREHFYKMRFFVDNFIDCPGDKVMCKLCKHEYIPKSSIIVHAADEHKLIPWYRPPDEYITFFKNSIVPLGTKFYCCLCDRVINSRWFGALAHARSRRHRKVVKIKEEDINQEALSVDFCKKLSNNMIFPFDSTLLRCWVCNYIIDGYENHDKHIDSDKHISKLTEKVTELLERKNKIYHGTRKSTGGPSPANDESETTAKSSCEAGDDVETTHDQSNASDDKATVL
ncbi:uncharacterized protein LOC130669943 [Microplitis mediator]|uniref:uncharacterized protein LOC130669943 n=1 Tax=Microplitis mediator TaxID=375433 RepID=UPI0025546A16|nr:uncharacterized protein LOC130669943 [Microplitis mediator]XP_057329089.1 uncharacterized protein LOC130669943 [Microplitis mediator]XP_057329090.1 uncharacterized protein LOC130669943 [Microplitis mediator]